MAILTPPMLPQIFVDLRLAPFNVIPDDPTKGAQNLAGTQLAVNTYAGLNALLLNPRGTIYWDHSVPLGNAFLRLGAGVGKVTLAGHGRDTRIVGNAPDVYPGEHAMIEIDQIDGVVLKDFFIEHGLIKTPDPAQRNFLIRVNNTNAGGAGEVGKTRRLWMRGVSFGKTFGDALAFQGGSLSDNVVTGIDIDDINMSLAGHTMSDWAPSTGYVAGQQVNNTVITCVAKASLTDTDYIEIGDVGDRVLVRKQYEFDTAGNGATAGRIQVNVSTDTTAAQVAARLRTAILANQPSLTVVDVGGGVLRLGQVATAKEVVANGGFTINADSYICVTPGTSGTGAGVTGGVYPSTGPGDNVTDNTVVWERRNGIRYAARAGVTFQRGYDGIKIGKMVIENAQNSPWDMESTGSGVRRLLDVDDLTIRNNGNTSIGASIGSTASGLAENITFNNLRVYEGRVQLTYTKNLKIINLDNEISKMLPGDETLANLEIRGTNEGIRIVNPDVRRTGGAAGFLIDSRGASFRVEGGRLRQDTAEDIFTVDAGEVVFSKTKMEYNGPSPSTRSVGTVQSVTGDVSEMTMDACHVACSTGTLGFYVKAASRGSYGIRQININHNHGYDGTVAALAYYSKQAGSYMDPNPTMQGNDFGDAELYVQVDENDSPVDDAVFPRTEGNRKGSYTIIGTVDPTGNVRAPQGCKYVWINGDSSKTYFKQEGAGFGGWCEITMGSPSFSAYQLPSTSADFTALIGGNGLTTVAPMLSYDCQEDGSGGHTDLAAIIGSIALIASGSVTYNNAETGYTDESVGIPDNAAGTGFSSTAAGLANPATTSRLLIVVGRLTAVPAAGRGLFHISENDQIRISNVGGQARARVLLAGNDVTPAVNLSTSQIKIWMIQVNETDNTVFFGNEDFKSTPAYSVASSSAKRLGVGGFDATSAPFHALRIWYWEGADSEWTEAQKREYAVALGAGVAW